MLFLTGSIVGVFAAQDLLLFYVFFEAMLIPLYVLIGVWGGARRACATLKFVVYTMAGSLLMLAAIIGFGLPQGTFDLVESGTCDEQLDLPRLPAAFAVKAPLFPFHGWLRRRLPRVAAGGRRVLSGVVSKAAVYGFLRIAIAKFPEPVDGLPARRSSCSPRSGSSTARCSRSARRTSAASSPTRRMAQMGLIMLGLFALNDLGVNGAILQLVNHGLVSATLFLLAGMVERADRHGRVRAARRDGARTARCSPRSC